MPICSTNEIITSLMLNYVAALVISYLIFDSESYWRDTSSPTAKVFPQGKNLPEAASWPVAHVGSLVLPFGLLLGIVIAALIWVLYTRTRFGFEVQVIGDSPRAASYAGMRTRRKILAVMALSGAIAGIGGASQDGDFRHTLDPRGLTTAGYGYAGIVIAALARYNPFAVCLVAFLVGGLQNAGYTLQGADFPSGLVGVMQGLILFCALGGELLVRYRIRFDPSVAQRRGARVILAAGGINNSVLVVVLASAVIYGTPLLFAALGELLTERSGVLNLGVEGMMLVGAVLGFWGVQRTGSLPLAIVVAAIAGAAMAAIHAFLVVTLRANQIVSGLALTIFAGAAGPVVVSRQRPESRRPAGTALVQPLLAAWLADGAGRRPDPVQAVGARLRVVAVRRSHRGLPEPDPARPERAGGRRVARRGRCDGHQRRRLSVRAHDGGRGVRRCRWGLLLAGDHAAVG